MVVPAPCPSSDLTAIWIPLIAALIGAVAGSLATASQPVIKDWVTERLFGRRNAVLDSMDGQYEWLKDRETQLIGFLFELSHDPVPDRYRRQILLARLDRMDQDWARQWIMADAEIPMLRQCAEESLAQCRNSMSELSRMRDLVGDRTFFPL
jgi:hypothetical protein